MLVLYSQALFCDTEHQMAKCTYYSLALKILFNPFQAAASVAPPEPPKPVEKGPMPSEHKVVQDIFSSLVHNCSNVATNAVSRQEIRARVLTDSFTRFNIKKWRLS